MLPNGYTLRPAVVADLATLTRLRLCMFAEFWNGAPDVAAFAASDEAFFVPRMASGDAAAWLALAPDGEPVASAAVAIFELPPKPWALDGRAAYICSMFTHPAHRRLGLGRCLFGECLDFARARGLACASLHAAPMGRPLYESFGFAPTPEMRLFLSRTEG